MMDEELANWRSAWLAEVDPPALLPDIRRMAEREKRQMVLRLGGQLLWSLALLGVSAWWAWRWRSLESVLWAAVIWILTFAAARFAIRNTAGTWRSAGQSTAAFVDLTRRRCHASLRAVRFGRRLLAVNLAIVVPWLSWDFARCNLPGRNYAIGMVLTAVLTAGYLIAFAWLQRKKLAELERLNRFDEERGYSGGMRY